MPVAGTVVGSLNQLVTKNPDTVAGGDFGEVVGTRANQTLGFYGVEGVTRQATPTDLAGVIDVLVKLGLVA